MFGAFLAADDTTGLCRKILGDSIRVVIVLEFLVNAYTFPLAVELVLVAANSNSSGGGAVSNGETGVDHERLWQAADKLLESRDEYAAENVFWVPPEARWQAIQDQARQANIATLFDDAMYAIERDNPKLKGKLPRDYARRSIAPERLGGLIDR